MMKEFPDRSSDKLIENASLVVPDRVLIFDLGDQKSVGFASIKKIDDFYDVYIYTDLESKVVRVGENELNNFFDSNFKRILCFDLEDRLFFIENDGKTNEQLLDILVPAIHSSQTFATETDYNRAKSLLKTGFGVELKSISFISDITRSFSEQIGYIIKTS